MFFECRTTVAAPKAVESQNECRPVVKGMSTECARRVAVRISVHLVGEGNGDIVFAGKREQMCDLSGDGAKRFALFLFSPFEPIKAGCTVECDEIHFFAELYCVLDCFFLLLEAQCLGDENPGCNFIERRVRMGARELFHPVGRQPFGVDKERGLTAGGSLDSCREDDVRLASSGCTIHLPSPAAVEAATE